MWDTPKTNWADNNLVTALDFNRIEKNTVYLQTLLG